MENLTLYDVGKSVCAQLPELTESELFNSKQLVKNYLVNQLAKDEDYFMLLNHEIRYFTLFHNCCGSTEEEITEEVFEIVSELGPIKTVQYSDSEGNAVEFWIGDKIYLFFPYTRGVVEV